jgi:hypothetical protein
MPSTLRVRVVALRGHFGQLTVVGLTIKARSDGLLGPGQLILLSYLLQDRQVLHSPRKIYNCYGCQPELTPLLSSVPICPGCHLFYPATQASQALPTIVKLEGGSYPSSQLLRLSQWL